MGVCLKCKLDPCQCGADDDYMAELEQTESTEEEGVSVEEE
jgi:hypothetical protein